MRALIVSGGTLSEPAFYRRVAENVSLVVCADGGYLNCEKLGLIPDVVIGDFDSVDRARVFAKTVFELPTEKERTDTHECVCYCIEKGCTEILLIGGIGSRMDHTLANIHLLSFALQHGVQMKIMNEHNEIFLIDQTAEIPRKEGWHISLLPLFPADGISSEGLYYPLHQASMDIGNPYGVSNEFTKDAANVNVEKGQLIAIVSRD